MKFKALILNSLIVCSLFSCNGNKKGQNEEANQEQKQEQKNVVNSPNKGVTIVTPYIYMENSASMKGYNDKDCNGFTSVLSELVGIYGRDKTKTFFYSDGFSQSYSADKFADMIASKQVKYGKSSPLHLIIDSIINKKNSLNFFITDGIMSGSDEQIRKNPKYNIYYREELQNSLADKLKNKDLAISVYQFESFFNGTYYCYDNTKVQLSKNRPFYVIALGEKEQVKDFKSKVEKGMAYFKPKNDVHLGFIDTMSIKVYAASQGGVNDKVIEVDMNQVRKNGKKISSPESDEEKISYLDLSIPLPEGLPKYMKTNEYLKENLSLIFNDEKIADKLFYYNEKDQVVHAYIHPYSILKKNSFYSILKYSLPKWCNKDSSLDDKNIKSEMFPTTFNLSYFIMGLQMGVEPNAKEIWNVEYKIIKK